MKPEDRLHRDAICSTAGYQNQPFINAINLISPSFHICCMKKRFVLLLLLMFRFADAAHTQPHYFTHYQVEDGLSNNAVLCIMQDNPGFMWFGTRDGLNRFDGLSYKIFRNNPSNKNSIGSNAIM